jgi:hypothetical protein
MALPLRSAEGADIGASESLSHPAMLARRNLPAITRILSPNRLLHSPRLRPVRRPKSPSTQTAVAALLTRHVAPYFDRRPALAEGKQ